MLYHDKIKKIRASHEFKDFFNTYGKEYQQLDEKYLDRQDIILELAQRHPTTKKNLPLMFEFDNAKIAIQGMPELLEKLSKKYPLYIISNIYPASYFGWTDTIDRTIKGRSIQEIVPEIFCFFNPDRVQTGEGKHVHIRKPEPDMYIIFKQRFNAGNQKIIIFIDDKESNIPPALTNGFDIGIVFTSPEQLEDDLATLGIFLPKSRCSVHKPLTISSN